MTRLTFHTVSAAFLLAVAAAAPALAQESTATSAPAAAEPEQARIPFLDNGGIRDWRRGDDDTLYVQDRHRNWYEATLMRPVVGTGSLGTFDRFATIIIEGERYPLSSLFRLPGEPPREEEEAQAENSASRGDIPPVEID
jgi:hypothetical protein